MICKYYIGTYTEPILFGTGEVFQGQGKGIYQISLDTETKETQILCCTEGIKNPSFLVLSADRCFLFAVNELKEFEGEKCGSVSSFAVLPDGRLQLISLLPTHGQDPCHVEIVGDSTLVVANFMTGSVCSYRIAEDGSLTEASFHQHVGSSIDPKRQLGPHAHSCIPVPGSDRILIPDLGMDKLVCYAVQEDSSLLPLPAEDFCCTPGGGPRYGEFHPTNGLLYVIHELASTLAVLRRDPVTGTYTKLQEIDTISDKTDNICADLHITADGRYLLASNRGHDSITVFAIGEDGLLTVTDNAPCGGLVPRNFAIESESGTVLVGNQSSDTIQLLSLDEEKGTLTPITKMAIGSPVCIRKAGI